MLIVGKGMLFDSLATRCHFHTNLLVLSVRHSIDLPSINHMDAGRVKRKEVEYQRKHSAAMPNPLHLYTGPPHLHSNHQFSVANAVPGSFGGLLSPPESRRTSGDEKESQRPTARQSLPSIHDALGLEQPLAFLATVPPPSSIRSAPQHYLSSSAATLLTEQRARCYPSDPQHVSQGPSDPLLHPQSPILSAPASKASPLSPHPPTQADSLPHPPFSESQPPYSTPQNSPKLPALHLLKTTRSPSMSAAHTNILYPSHPPLSTTYESSAAQSAGPMNQRYPYSQYPPSCALLAPSARASSLAYPLITSTCAAPPWYPPQSWLDNLEMSRLEEKKIGRSSLLPCGEPVKRHLESFDLEASLEEMADGSGRIAEFSKTYRQQAHENEHMGMDCRDIPRLEEIVDMLKQSGRVLMSLQHMQDFVFNHHQVSVMEPPQDPRYRPRNGYDDSGSNYGDNTKRMGGFAGGDNKIKKRGVGVPHPIDRVSTLTSNTASCTARTLS
jgi:glutamate--cysteine ligase catalytic subunit